MKLRNFQLSIIYTSIILGVWVSAGLASGWTQGTGHFYAKLSYIHFSNSHTFNENGDKLPNIHSAFLGSLGGVFDKGSFQSTGVSFYSEFGVSNHIDLIIEVFGGHIQNTWEFAKGNNPDIIQRNKGLMNFSGGVKINFISAPIVFSLKVLGQIPPYRNDVRDLNIEPEDLDFYNDRPALGNGASALSIMPQLGYSFKRLPIWIEFEGGIRFRSNLFSDEIPLFLQAGLSIKNHTFIAISITSLKTFGNGAWPNFYRNDIGKGPYLINDQEFVNLGLSAGKKVFRFFWLEGSIIKTVSGKRVPAGLNIILGLSAKH